MKILENVVIEKIVSGGVGLSTNEQGKKILIKGSVLPGTTVSCRVVKNKKDFIEAELLSIKDISRINTVSCVCPHYVHSRLSGHEMPVYKVGCGGCKRQLLSYTDQLLLKKNIVVDAMRMIGPDANNLLIHDPISSPESLGYRNKIEFSFGTYKDGYQGTLYDKHLGFHKQGQFAQVIDVDRCFLVSSRMHEVFSYLKKKLLESGLPVYNQKTHSGCLRHLVIREGVNTGNILVNLVIAEKNLIDNYKNLRETIKQDMIKDEFLHKELKTFVVTYNDGLADIVQSSSSYTQTLWGDGYIFEDLIFKDSDELHVRFRVSPFSFFQTNTLGAQELFRCVADQIGSYNGKIIDLYCGAGSIGLTLLKLGIGSELFGVEISEEAIIDAKNNAILNHLQDQSSFVAGKVEKIVHENTSFQEFYHDAKLVIVDPPRDGLHPKAVEFLGKMRTEKYFKLLYVSCNPVSLARDLKLLKGYGFQCSELYPVDMFPQTHHVEIVTLLN